MTHADLMTLIESRRAELGYSIAFLAKLADTTPSTLTDWLANAGTTELGSAKLLRVLAALGLAVAIKPARGFRPQETPKMGPRGPRKHFENSGNCVRNSG